LALCGALKVQSLTHAICEVLICLQIFDFFYVGCRRTEGTESHRHAGNRGHTRVHVSISSFHIRAVSGNGLLTLSGFLEITWRYFCGFWQSGIDLVGET